MAKKILTAYEQGQIWGSCEAALEERKKFASQSLWYKNCKRGDWLFWQFNKLSVRQQKEIGAKLKLITERIVKRAIKKYALHCDIAEVRQWAKNWLSGKDRSAEAARAAVVAAKAAAEATVEAVWAARAAVEAVWVVRAAVVAVWVARAAVEAAVEAAWTAWAASAARVAARAAELELQARDIHRFIPNWPE